MGLNNYDRVYVFQRFESLSFIFVLFYNFVNGIPGNLLELFIFQFPLQIIGQETSLIFYFHI
jgi:hypothetical protein